MTQPIAQLIADLVRAGTDADLVGRVAEALAEGAGRAAAIDATLEAAVDRALFVPGRAGDAQPLGRHAVTSRDVVTLGDVTSVTPVTPRDAVTARRNSMSAGAVRTRRYRERQLLRGAQGNSPGIPDGSNVIAATSPMSVTSVTTVTPLPAVGDGTPLKGVPRPHRAGQSPQRLEPGTEGTGSQSARTQRLRAGKGRGQNRQQRELPLVRKLEGGATRFVLQADPVFAELSTMRGKSIPTDRNGGWHFPPAEVEEARRRIAERRGQGGEERDGQAVGLGQSSDATGPPMQATG